MAGDALDKCLGEVSEAYLRRDTTQGRRRIVSRDEEGRTNRTGWTSWTGRTDAMGGRETRISNNVTNIEF